MFYLINTISDAVLHFLEHHGSQAAIGVIVVAVVLFVLRAIIKISERNGPKQDV